MNEIFIESIEFDGYEEQQCITLNDPFGQYITDDFLITHNSTMTILVLLYVACCFALMRNPRKYFNFPDPQPLDSKILLPNKKYYFMGDAKVGDRIYSPTNKESIITGVFPKGIQPAYKITTEDGKQTKAGLTHIWLVSYRSKNNKPIWEKVRTSFMINHPEIKFYLPEEKDLIGLKLPTDDQIPLY